MVLVMDDGRMVEYDHPYVLLKNKDGFFSKMLEETSKNTQSQLQQVAKEAFENKFNTKTD